MGRLETVLDIFRVTQSETACLNIAQQCVMQTDSRFGETSLRRDLKFVRVISNI